MNNKSKRVLVVATSRKTQGGITAVVRAHEQCVFWKDYQIRWLETHTDGSLVKKCWYALKSFCVFLVIVPCYDLVHIHLSEIPSMYRKLPFFYVARLFGKKTIVHFHSFSPDTTINGKRRNLYRYVFSRADRVVVLSLLWKQWVRQYLSLSDNVSVIYNPATRRPVVSRFNERKPMILYAGALNSRKGYADLIFAFSAVAHLCPEWRLVLAGNGEIPQGKQFVSDLGLADKVFFPGWVRGQNKEQLFLEASVFCLPSYAEGFPTAVVEACSYGIPVITTTVGGIPDVMCDGVNGLLFTSGDVETLSKHLYLLMTDSALRETLGKASLQLADTIFSLEETGKQIRLLYETLLGTTIDTGKPISGKINKY